MANTGADQIDQTEICGCLGSPHHRRLVEKELGSDKHYAEIALLSCPLCGRRWLRYFYEIEAFTSSGRWYLGLLNSEQTEQLTEENARSIMEQLDWYFFGGSYYQGKAGKTSGKISLNP